MEVYVENDVWILHAGDKLYQVNEAACPQDYRQVSEVPNLHRLRSFVRFEIIRRDGSRETIARGLAG